jgi:PKD repeat protein
LFDPEYDACGQVTINGYVGADDGVITRLSWDWGDGVIADSWFPAYHQYAANGRYSVHVTAYSSTGGTRAEEATADVTNADDPGCGTSTIVLDLHDPEYGMCGDVSVNGYVGANDGSSITRLSWDWGDGVIADSWFPANHHFSADGAYLIRVTAYSNTGSTRTESVSAVVTNAEAANCGYKLRLHPAVILLRDGHTSETLRPELRDPDGKLVSLVGRQVTFTSSHPPLAQVAASGAVSSTGFGEAQIEAAVAGFSQHATARVIAGRFHVNPAIQLLSPSGPASGTLTLYAANADGTLVNLQGYAVTFQGGNYVANVNAQGTVTALAPPLSFGHSPYFNAGLDGQPSNNASFTRVTTDALGLNMNLYTGEHVAFWTADQMGSYPYGQLMGDLQVLLVSDHAYRLEQRLAGTTPFNGDTQFMVLDPGFDADGTVPCGLAGNPLRLGIGVDNGRSCFGGVDWLQWGIMYHEMGHNFMVQQPFLDWLSGISDPIDYSEGMASMLGIYARDAFLLPLAVGLRRRRRVAWPWVRQRESAADLLDRRVLRSGGRGPVIAFP